MGVPVFSGTKRKMMAPASPNKFVKKQRFVRTAPRMGTSAGVLARNKFFFLFNSISSWTSISVFYFVLFSLPS